MGKKQEDVGLIRKKVHRRGTGKESGGRVEGVGVAPPGILKYFPLTYTLNKLNVLKLLLFRHLLTTKRNST